MKVWENHSPRQNYRTSSMEIEIKESNLNKSIRVLVKTICVFSMFFGIVFMIFQILLGNTLISVIGFPIIFLSYYIGNRISKIKLIKQDSILLASGRKEIQLRKKEILCITKLVKFTFTERFWLKVNLNKGKFPILNCYFVMNEPKYDFIDKFYSMGLRVKNMPFRKEEHR